MVFMTTHSLLLYFHPKPSFVMHDGIVIVTPKFANLSVTFKLCLRFLLYFSFMLYSWNGLVHVVTVVFYVFVNCCTCVVLQWYV